MVKMKRKCPTISVINPNSDMPCSALLLPSGTISINTNLLSLSHTKTLGKLLIAQENSVSAQLRTQFRTPQGDLKHSLSCQGAFDRFLHTTKGSVRETTSPLSMGRLLKQRQGCVIPELAAGLGTRPPFPAFILLQALSWVPPTLPFSAKCWKRLKGKIQQDANT